MIVSCDLPNLLITWQGVSSSYSTTKIFYATNNSNGVSSWVFNASTPLTLGNWTNYNQILPYVSYSTSTGFMYISWIGNTSDATASSYTRIFAAFSNNKGSSFIHNLSTNFLGYNGSPVFAGNYNFSSQSSTIDTNGNLHIIFLYQGSNNTNEIINDIFTSYIQYNNTLSTWGSWTTPHILSYNSRSISITNSGYRELMAIVDNKGVVNFLYKAKIYNYSYEVNFGVSPMNCHATFYNGNYSDTKSLLNTIFHMGY